MNFQDLENFRLDQAVRFHDELNPAIWTDDKLSPDVRRQLLDIAQDFIDHLGLDDLDVQDITLSGSNAAYTYTPHSDLDLHLIVDMSKLNPDEVYRELFNSKKVLYNDSHDIKIHGYDVELYVQDAAEPVKSLGEYSIKNDRWIKFPRKTRTNMDERATREKFRKLVQLAQLALANRDLDKLDSLIDTLKRYRQAGLDEHGEFGPENLAYKAIRSQGVIQQLYDLREKLHSRQLSLDEGEDDEYAPPGAPMRDVFRIKNQIAKQQPQKLVTVRGRDIGGSFTDAELQSYGLRKNQTTGNWTGTQAQWDRFNSDRGIKEAKKPQQHTEIIKHQVGDWVVYLDNHSMIRAATRGIGPRMMSSIITWVDRVPNLDQQVPVGGDFWIQDEQTNSSFYFKRLNIPSEPLAVRVETGVKDVPRAGSRTPVFRVNAYPGPETPQHIKNMKQLALINRFVGPDVMANRLANVVQKNPMQHPDVITNPETQDSKRYDRAFTQSRKQNKPVKESSALDKPTLTPQQIMRKHGVSYEQLIDQLTQGIKVELEHTTNSEVAYKIALAHLAEDPDYYTKLARVGLEEVGKQGIADSGDETSWSDSTEKITLQDILELTKHIKQINLAINDNLKSKLLHWDGNPEEIERINQVTVSNQFPILVMLDGQGQINWILDGNHRLHKAIRAKAKTIPAKLIKPSDLNDKAKRVFQIKEQSVTEGVPQPGKSSGKPISWISPERVITKYLTLNEILNSVQGIPYYNEVVKDRDAKDFTWGVTKKVLEYARELIIRPDAYKNWPPIIVVDGKLQDGAHRISTINLMQKRVQPNNPIWKNAKLKVEFGESDNVRQGVTEASGYIPSPKEKNDPRFRTALTVDVKPDSIKRNAQKLGLGRIQRAGIPPTARTDGKA